LLAELRSPADLTALATRLNWSADLLEALVDVGVSVGELKRRGSTVAVKGHRAKALMGDGGEAFAYLVSEYVDYHAAVYRELPDRLVSGERGDYLAARAELVAQSSRTVEPFLGRWVSNIVKRLRSTRVLDVGCGSGTYLAHAARASSTLIGTGVELRPEVVEQARANLALWGFADRCQVIEGDLRNTTELKPPFDLVMLLNNVYYFPVNERVELLKRMRQLAAGGAFALASLFKDDTPSAADLDLALRATKGCYGLPRLDELLAQLDEAGFAAVQTTKLLPTEPLFAIIAKWQQHERPGGPDQ
jgi:SAM-dependent methyltransferase